MGLLRLVKVYFVIIISLICLRFTKTEKQNWVLLYNPLIVLQTNLSCSLLISAGLNPTGMKSANFIKLIKPSCHTHPFPPHSPNDHIFYRKRSSQLIALRYFNLFKNIISFQGPLFLCFSASFQSYQNFFEFFPIKTLSAWFFSPTVL